MTNDDVLDEFRAAGALREGHFILSSGLHSAIFLQKNLVFMHPDRCERLCRALAEKITATIGAVDVCVSPAVGGIIPGYETARQLGVPSIYVEREGGVLKFRRAFSIEPGVRVAMIEDIVSTGLSSRECVDAIEAAGGIVACCGAIVDRSSGQWAAGSKVAGRGPGHADRAGLSRRRAPAGTRRHPGRGSRQPEAWATSK